MILHFCVLDKFIPPFIELINNEFDNQEHHFLVYGDRSQFPYKNALNIEYQPSFIRLRGNIGKNIANVNRFIELAKKSKKIILHGLWCDHLVALLSFYSSLLKKCYWVIWGGDLYIRILRERGIRSSIHEFFRRIVIKRMGNFVSQVKGDYTLTKEWYRAKGKWHDCFVYPSNVYCGEPLANTEKEFGRSLNILLGNSADPSNNHFEALDLLLKFRHGNIKIFAPLSYGNKDYANGVISKGKERFGAKFQPLTDFMAKQKYDEFLRGIDIAIFNHNRQQAFGNIVNLLGMGKKVYIRKEISTWNALSRLGVKIFDLDSFDLKPIDSEIARKNSKIVGVFFSRENLLNQLNEIFAGDV